MKKTTPEDLVLPLAGDASVPRLRPDLTIEVVDPDTGRVSTLRIAPGHPGEARATISSLITALEDLDEHYRDRELLLNYGQVAS